MALKELVERCKSPEEGRDRLMNHVVLIKSYSAASGVQQNAAIRATTCGEHMEKRWPSIGLRLLSDISVVLFKGDFENTYRRGNVQRVSRSSVGCIVASSTAAEILTDQTL